MPRNIDWTDLQYVLAVARHGTLASAARALGVSHTTVLRRVTALEEAQGLRLFERLSSGYALTAGGEEMLAAAQSVAEVVIALERRLAGQDLRLEGLLRVTVVDSLMASLLPPILASFQAEHPAVQLELSVSAAVVNLNRRDADVAIRISAAPPETLIGRRIASVGMAVYRARAEAGSARGEADWAAERWIGASDALADTNIGRWMREHLPDANIVLRSDSITAMAQAVKAGIGLAPLPCYLGDALPGLERASGLVPLKRPSDLWILTHEDLRRTARVRAFTEFVGNALMRIRSKIEGKL